MFGTSSAGTGFPPEKKPTSFLFGSSNSNTTRNTGTGFGSSAGSGFLLGGNNANAGGIGSKPATASFGSSTANNMSNNSGGLFGGSNSTTGATPSAGGLFGGAANNALNTNNASGGLFGASSTNTAGSTGTSLFGGASANNATTNNTSAFGKPAEGLGNTFGAQGSIGTTQNATSGGLFGNSQASQSGQTSTGGLFGNSNAPSAGTGLFGGSQTQQQSQPATGAGGGLFGNNSSTGGLFGSQLKQQTTNVSNNAVNGFQGANTNTSNNAQPSFSWSGNQQPNPGSAGSLSNLEIKIPSQSKTQQNASNYTPAVNDQLMKLKEQWDPNSAKCALKTHLYNKFSEQEIAQLLQQPRPANETPEDWEKAMAKRPSPLYYPVKVTSFSELAQRIEVQLEHVAKSRIFLNNIYEKLSQLSSQRDLDTTARIMKAKARHTKLSRRLLKLATLLAVLKLKGYPLLPEEEEISKEFQTLNARLSDPNGAVGKLSDIYARLAILKGRSDELSSQLESSINTMNGGLDNLANAGSDGGADASANTKQIVELLTKLLYKQQMGLGYLNDVVLQDLAVVTKKTAKN